MTKKDILKNLKAAARTVLPGGSSVRIRVKVDGVSHDVAPPGRCGWTLALEVLNRKLGKKPTTALDDYTEEDYAESLREIKKPGFLRHLEQAYHDSIDMIGASAEYRMRIARAHAVANLRPFSYEQDLVERAKTDKGPEVRQLWDELTDLGVFVHSMTYFSGDRTFAFEMDTQLGFHEGRFGREEILQIVRRDRELSVSVRCPACNSAIYAALQGGTTVGECQACGSIFGSISRALVRAAARSILAPAHKVFWEEVIKEPKLAAGALLDMIINFDNIYEYDAATGLSWVKLPLLQNKEQASEGLSRALQVTGIQGGDHSNPSVRLTVPISRAKNSKRGRLGGANCRECLYCLEVGAASKKTAIDNLDVLDCERCLFPYSFEDIFPKGFELVVRSESAGDKAAHARASVWNALLRGLLECLPKVQDVNPGAYYPELGGIFDGPLCPRFLFNKEAGVLVENGGPRETCGTTEAIFGRIRKGHKKR